MIAFLAVVYGIIMIAATGPVQDVMVAIAFMLAYPVVALLCDWIGS